MRAPNVLLFEDDKLFREIWVSAKREQGIGRFFRFASWEKFLRTKLGKKRVPGAIAFVDFDFKKEKSKYNGAQIAEKLRKLGAARIYSTTACPSYVEDHLHLFEAVIGKLPPENLRAYLDGPVAPAENIEEL